MFQTIFYQPLLNFLVFLYNITPFSDIGIVVIVFAAIIRAALWPLNNKMLKSQQMMQALQPKIDALKKEFADNKEAQSKAMMELYKQEKVNPFAGCLPILIQIPIFIAIVQVFRAELGGQILTSIYPFIHNPGVLNPIAFGFIDFSTKNYYLAVLAGLGQFAQAKMMPVVKPTVKGDGSKDESMAVMMNKQMMYLGPIITTFVCFSMPSGLAFYWFLFSLASVIQQYYIFNKKA
ncbi:YidC/Oxa1 family membrane protein insertase [Candidatus Falkowbacteria bacterium]|nr:YidC/Oxa1 family membrane protein insertase [Candidatus Falkowbacteria bacterium]